MATEKSWSGKRGHVACTVHVLLYTLAVALFTGIHPLFWLAVAVPHWIIDRWSLANYWLRAKNGYWPKDAWEKAPLCAANSQSLIEQGQLTLAAVVKAREEALLIKNVWKVAFAAPVYIFNDNTLHWVCLWFTVKYFFS